MSQYSDAASSRRPTARVGEWGLVNGLAAGYNAHMCNKRTLVVPGALLVLSLAACADDGLKNCDEVSGTYYPIFEQLAAIDPAAPGACNEPPFESLDLTEDNLTYNTGTSTLNTRVDRFGCHVRVTYTQTVANPGDPDDRTNAVVRNNGDTKYRVQEGGVLVGEAVYARNDRNGNEMCRALFSAMWLPEEIARERNVLSQ